MRSSPCTLAMGLLLSVALPAGAATAADPGEQLMLERAGYWLAQHRLDLAGEMLRRVLATNPGQPDALYQLGVLAQERGDRGSAQQYFDRLRLAAPADKRAAELVAALTHPAAPVTAAAAATVTRPPAAAQKSTPQIPAAPANAPKVADEPSFDVASADSDDLVPPAGPAPARGPAQPRPGPAVPSAVLAAATRPREVVPLPPMTVSDGDTAAPSLVAAAAVPAGSADLGITAKAVQLAQVEIEAPPPVGGYQPITALKPYSPTDTLETYIDRDLTVLEAQSNPTLIAGFGFRSHTGAEGTGGLTELGVPIQASFSPWYTGTARIDVVPVYLDAGTPANGNLNTFGGNPILFAAGLRTIPAGDQNATGVGLLGSYTLGDYSAQFGTTPLGFPVTNFVGNVAYSPKFLDGNMTVRFEGQRVPVTDTVLSYAGTHANLTAANAATGGAFAGSGSTWGGVVKTGPRVTVFYDDQFIGAYGGVGGAFITGTNVAQNSEIDALLGAYFRPLKTDYYTLRTGVSLFYISFDKNLGGYSFGQGGYFSPQNFAGLGFPVEVSGHAGPFSYLAAVTLGIQSFNADRSAVFPDNPNAQAALQALSPSTAFNGGIASGIGFGYNLKGQVEYAIDNTASIGLAGSFNNGSSFNDGIVQLYLRKTFDWFTPVAFRDDPESIVARDQPANRL